MFRCLKTGVILIHHVDDIRAVGPADVLADLFEKEFPKYCEVQAGELEKEGTVEFLGRTKIRTKDAIGTVPDVKHRKAIIAAAGNYREGPLRGSEQTARSDAGSPAG